ncbi:MAG TPA: hypothetical protein VHB77_04450, partial [Planctomycetaceae bacterium]|nr:hypothetical protein [Planctomycetaceae bacterium]
MSRRNSSPSVALFPFLAVLVCVMGSLILLLMVTTRRIRQLQVAAEQAEQEVQVEVPEVIVPAPSTPVPSGPTPSEIRAASEAEWRRKLEELLALREERKDELDKRRKSLARIEGELKRAEAGLAELQGKLQLVHGEKGQDSETRQFIEKEDQRVTRDIARTQAKIAVLKKQHADQQSRFAFIPYDGASGTTRRPIYIECTGEGLRILPEGEMLSSKDLAGFTKHYNPLLLGTQGLVQYWTGQLEVKPDAKETMSVPYVLLLVRPSGCISYYYARELLTHLGQPFGYELIEDDYPLYFPPPDPNAQRVLRQAIELTYKNRDDVLRTLTGEREVELEPFDPTGGTSGWGPENYSNRNGSGGGDRADPRVAGGNRTGSKGGKGFGTTPGSLGDAVSRSRGGSGTNGGTGTGTQKSGRQGGTSVAANRGAGSTAGGWGDGFGPSSSGKGDGTGTGTAPGTGSGTATGGDAPYAQLGLGSGEEGDEHS